MQLLQTAFRDICIMTRHLIVGVKYILTTMIILHVHYANSSSTAVCTWLPTVCALQVILLILVHAALVANLMTYYHDAVISERCSGFTMQLLPLINS